MLFLPLVLKRCIYDFFFFLFPYTCFDPGFYCLTEVYSHFRRLKQKEKVVVKKKKPTKKMCSECTPSFFMRNL